MSTANKYLEEIWKLLPFLDTQLIHILNSFKESQMYQAVFGISKEIIPTNESIINIHKYGRFPSRFSEYFKIIYEFELYLNKEFNEYTDYSMQRKNALNTTP